MKTISLCTRTNEPPNSLLWAICESQCPGKDGTYGEAVGQARPGAVALQDTVVQQVPRPLRREGGAFALHDAQLTHHTGTWKKKKIMKTLFCHRTATLGSHYFHSASASSAGYYGADNYTLPLNVHMLLYYQNEFQILFLFVGNNYYISEAGKL